MLLKKQKNSRYIYKTEKITKLDSLFIVKMCK